MSMNMLGLRSSCLVSGLVLLACEPKPVEETHVVLTACGLELACEPMTLVNDVTPSPALECT